MSAGASPNRGRRPARTPDVTSWTIPGLIDAHVHLTMDFGARTGLDRGSDALVRANGEAQLASGVVAVRDAGRIPPGARLDAAPAALQVVSCGAVLAPPGRFFPGRLHVEAPPADLVRIALAQLDEGAAWVKVIADFPRRRPRPLHAGGELRARRRGAPLPCGARRRRPRRGAHLGRARRARSSARASTRSSTARRSTRPSCASWRRAARSGCRRSRPSPAPGDAVLAAGAPAAPIARAILARYAETIPLAVDLGVPVLAGTDESPHGTLVRELEQLVRFGLEPGQAIDAATTVARAALEIADDGRRIVLPADPRCDLSVLREAGPAVVLV